MDDDEDVGYQQEYGDNDSQGSFDNDENLGKNDEEYGEEGDFSGEDVGEDEGMEVKEDYGEEPELFEEESRLEAGFKDIQGRRAGWTTLGETGKRRSKEERFEISLRKALAEIFDDESGDIMPYMFLFKRDPLVYSRNATLLVVAKKFLDIYDELTKSNIESFKKKYVDVDFSNFDIARYVRLIYRIDKM